LRSLLTSSISPIRTDFHSSSSIQEGGEGGEEREEKDHNQPHKTLSPSPSSTSPSPPLVHESFFFCYVSCWSLDQKKNNGREQGGIGCYQGDEQGNHFAQGWSQCKSWTRAPHSIKRRRRRRRRRRRCLCGDSPLNGSPWSAQTFASRGKSFFFQFSFNFLSIFSFSSFFLFFLVKNKWLCGS